MPVPQPAAKPVIVDRFVEKIVEVKVEQPKVVTVEVHRDVPIETVHVVELEKVINHIETEHKVVREYVDRIVPAPTYEQYAVQKDIIAEKIVNVKSIETKQVPQIQVVEKIVEKENFTTVTNTVPYYEQQIQVVDRFESSQVPVFTTQEKIVAVPEFQEKIFERIVVMPQVVEVIKYVTEICETDSLGVGLTVDVLEQERIYKDLQGVTRRQIEILLVELRKLRGTQPHLAGIIELLERYIVDFDKLAAVQRIVPVERERIVEKEVPRAVVVPTRDSESMKNHLAHTLLIEKLILELKRVKKENSNVKLQLDNDINLFFFTELYDQPGFNAGGNFQDGLNNYTREAIAKLNALGGNWTSDHELMLTTILQERFAMANLVKQANIEVEKAKAISSSNANAIKELENKWLPLQKLIKDKQETLNKILSNNPTLKGYPDLVALAKDFDGIVTGSNLYFEPLRVLETTFTVGTGTNWNRAVSRINELELNNQELATRLFEAEKKLLGSSSVDTNAQYTLNALKSENARLVKEIDTLKRTNSTLNISGGQGFSQSNEANEARLRQSNARIQELELQLKTANSRIADLESQLRSASLRVQEVESQLKASTLRVQEVESQLKSAKEIRSSAASDTNQLVDSKYSSSSSNVNVTKSAYEAPNYASSSQYSVDSSSSGLTSSGVRQSANVNYIQPSGSTYATGGTSAYQSSTKLTTTTQNTPSSTYATTTNTTGNTTTTTTTYGSSSGARTSSYGLTGTTGLTTGTTGSSSSSYGVSGSTGLSSSNYGTSGALYGTSGASGLSSSGYGSTTTTTGGPTYGTTGISSQYGATGTGASVTGASGSYSSSVSSSLSNSGLRQSGTNYTFQTKKF